MINRSGGGEIKSTLTLPTAEEQDRGQYLCVAENKVLEIVKHLVFDHYDEDDKISKDGNNRMYSESNLRLVALKPTSHWPLVTLPGRDLCR